MIDRVGRDQFLAAIARGGSSPRDGSAPTRAKEPPGHPAPYLAVLLDALRTHDGGEPDGLGAMFGTSLRLAAMDAVGRLAVAPAPPAAAVAPPVTAATVTPAERQGTAAEPPAASPPPAPARRARPMPAHEETVIKATAQRAGIDPDFLRAIRRVENGRPGREFGVLSVPAPTYRDQAKVAAETVRRTIGRFERTGRQAVDAAGRYTADFIRFFSNRYAPVGAANDPTNLNSHHSRNLLRVYGVQEGDSATV
jgi:hypothetical protein